MTWFALESYAEHHAVDVRTGVEVVRIEPDARGGWRLCPTSGEELSAPTLIVATGHNHTSPH